MSRKRTPPPPCNKDCEHIRTEQWPVKGSYRETTVAYRCFAPGPCRGYHMGTGLILPYVPAWCPKMERGKKVI